MSMSDPIADMLTRIRNGQMVDKAEVAMPSSKLRSPLPRSLKTKAILKTLKSRPTTASPNLP